MESQKKYPPTDSRMEQSGVSSDDEARRRKERFALRHTCPITFYR